jgi:hypothetical protein
MISEVGGKILDQFATNLADKLGTPEAPATPAAAEPAAESGEAKPKLEAVKPTPANEAEAIDLFEYAGSSVAKRLAPVLAGVAGLLVIVTIIRLLRRR